MAVVRINPIRLVPEPKVPAIIRQRDRIPIADAVVPLKSWESCSLATAQAIYEVTYQHMRRHLEFEYVRAINQADVGGGFIMKNLIVILDQERQWNTGQLYVSAYGQSKKRRWGRFYSQKEPSGMKMRIRVPHA